MGRKKPSPGVCGKCGRAVVRPTPEQILSAVMSSNLTSHAGLVHVCGHQYEDGRLIRVYCKQHDPRPGDWS